MAVKWLTCCYFCVILSSTCIIEIYICCYVVARRTALQSPGGYFQNEQSCKMRERGATY